MPEHIATIRVMDMPEFKALLERISEYATRLQAERDDWKLRYELERDELRAVTRELQEAERELQAVEMGDTVCGYCGR